MKKAQISQEKHKSFLSMMRENMNRYKQGNSVDPPYFVYYLCKSDESERVEDLKPFWVVDHEQEPEEVKQNQQEEKDEHVDDTRALESSSDEDDTETDTEPKKKIPGKTMVDPWVFGWVLRFFN